MQMIYMALFYTNSIKDLLILVLDKISVYVKAHIILNLFKFKVQKVMFSVIKPQAPFERLKIANDSAEIALCRAVILQAVVDASNTSNNAASKQFEKEALEWLFINNENFKEVCTSAGLEVDFVRLIASRMIALHKNKKL